MQKQPKSLGFTLVEIMIVVAIIAILAAIAIPAFNQSRDQSKHNAIQENLRIVSSAAEQYLVNTTDTSVAYASLAGTYFYTIASVAGEDYSTINIDISSTSISVNAPQISDSTLQNVTYTF